MTVTFHESFDLSSNDISNANTITAVTCTCSGDMYCDDIHVQDQVYCSRVQADGSTSTFDDIDPNNDDAWDLGGNTRRWNDLYLAGGIIGNIYCGTIDPRDDCVYDLGSPSPSWDNLYVGTVVDGLCDLAELQFVDIDIQPGDIVELNEWDSPEELKLYKKQLEECQKKNKDNPDKACIRVYGLMGKWKKAQPNSRKCPSIVSTAPGLAMGSSFMNLEAAKKGKMNYIALKGSVPHVFVEGEFKAGDIIVSAGGGKAKVNNDCHWAECIGYVKESGKDERSEVWVR